MNILGIIPARGGSKGVLRKNIRNVAGKPLIAYTIEAARGSCRLTDIVVTTDDEEIEKCANSFGVEVLSRPPDLAADSTPMVPVVIHALDEWENKKKIKYECAVLLQPTAPLRLSEDIDSAVSILEESDSDSVISVYRVFDNHPSRMYLLDKGILVQYSQENIARLRQELPPVYHRNGAVYVFKSNLPRNEKTLIGKQPLPLIMPKERSLNIDDEIDLICVEAILRKKTNYENFNS